MSYTREDQLLIDALQLKLLKDANDNLKKISDNQVDLAMQQTSIVLEDFVEMSDDQFNFDYEEDFD